GDVAGFSNFELIDGAPPNSTMIAERLFAGGAQLSGGRLFRKQLFTAGTVQLLAPLYQSPLGRSFEKVADLRPVQVQSSCEDLWVERGCIPARDLCEQGIDQLIPEGVAQLGLTHVFAQMTSST